MSARVPLRALHAFGAALGFFAGSVLRIRRAHVESSMALGGIPDPRRAATAMYRALGASIFEFLWLARPRAADLDAALEEWVRIDPDAERALSQARASGKGVVIAATHTGNWDLAACAVARTMPLLVVTKRLSIRFFDRFWQSTRKRYGVMLCEAREAMTEARRTLRQGGAVAMMIDQVPLRRRHAVMADFFGRPVHADKAPAALAAATGAPLLVAGAHRLADGTHRLTVLDVFYPEARRDWVERATRKSTAALESFVRRHPSDWLWLHRRWRSPSA